MKKLLLSTGMMCLLAAAANAQTRLSLYEEFSGENCGPCAQANPGLWTLLSANTSKVLLIKYQSPIPSAGPIYLQNVIFTDARMNYYQVPFAPYGRLNGTGLGTGSAAPGSPGHVANLLQSDIDAANTPSPFNITVTHSWNATGDSVTANINITAVSAFAPAAAQLKLRAGLIEHMVFSAPPGTNGETEFHNVVREMYPDAAGTAISNSWTAGQTQSLVIKGKVPSYLDKAQDMRFVVFIQNETDKAIAQTAVSTPVSIPVDIRSEAVTAPAFSCATGSTNVNATVTLKNVGSSPLNSAQVYYRIDNGAWQTYAWTGNIAAGATGIATLPAINVTPGSHVIYDSVTTPNAVVDINMGNNESFKVLAVHDLATNPLPIAEGFENAGNEPAKWTMLDLNGNFNNWFTVTADPNNVGHNNTKYLLMHRNFSYTAGETNIALMPVGDLPAGSKSLDFYMAYAQFQAENDKLEVVYTTNCGQAWTSIWSKQGTDLSTHVPTTSSFVPDAASWKLRSVDISSVPAGAILGFRATSDFGNNLFIDDVNMRSGVVTGIEEVVKSGYVQIYPNPAKDVATVAFSTTKSSSIQVQVVDAAGRVVATPVNGTYQAGAQQFQISTANLAAGIYNVKIQTEAGARIERLTVAK